MLVQGVTVTVKLQLAVLGGVAESLAVQVTVVTPSGKFAPDGGVHEAVTPLPLVSEQTKGGIAVGFKTQNGSVLIQLSVAIGVE